MPRRRIAVLATLALLPLLTSAALPALADERSTVRAKVPAAMRAAKSFVLTMTSASDLTMTLTFVAPDRYHSVLASNNGNRDVVLVGQTAYVSSDGTIYRKVDGPPEIGSALAQVRDMPVDQILTDKTIAGKTYGRFATTSAGPQRDQHLICSFEKRTYRIAECTNETLTMLFTRYDDPANSVAIPANVATPAPVSALEML